MGTNKRVIEEVESNDDEDTDTQGAGLSSSSNKRFVSDPLHFTGIDMGNRSGTTTRRSVGHRVSDGDDNDNDDDNSSSENDEDQREGAQFALQEKEEALVQSAMARIRRAQERGKKDVKLNKNELAALERRRKRLQEEEEARRKSASKEKERKRKKEKEPRISVPIAQLEPRPSSSSSSRKKGKKSPVVSDDNLPRHPSPANMADVQSRRDGMPPMGFFPPPNASRSRPRSSTLSQRPPSRAADERGSSPFAYPYSQPYSPHRHVSDGNGSRPRSSLGPLSPEDAWATNASPASSSSSVSRRRSSLDPLQYQTEGPRAPYHHAGAGASSRRHLAPTGPAGPGDGRRASAVPAAAGGGGRGGVRRQASPGVGMDVETSEEEESSSQTSDPDTSDDELGNGAQIVEPPAASRRGRRGEEILVEEERPDSRDSRRGSTRAKKSNNSSSPVKRKPVGSGGRKKRK